MPLRIANSRTDGVAVDFAGLTPESLAGRSLAEVRRTRVFHGNARAELGELFDVDGDPRDMAWRLVGDFSAVHWLGAGMAAGEIIAEGPVGRHAGAYLSGGRLDVHGNAGDWLGAEMRGGVLRVRGNVGNHAGAAYAGSPRGMTGGAIHVDGAAGDGAGQRLRRGLIAVAGDVGDSLGDRMLAGTILVFGRCGARCGLGMRRGTIALLGPGPPPLPPTFHLASRISLPMLGLIARELRSADFAADQLDQLKQPVDLFHGDFLELGRGEVLIASSAA
jgi:formylmethanofuran dehydrogenase subunit C